jgi:hypothetical protein
MNTQIDYIADQRGLRLLGRRRNFNRQMAFLFTIVPIALSALAVIAIGTAEKLHMQWLPILAMTATGIAAVLGAWQSLFANRKLWRANNATLASLSDLRWDIEYCTADATNYITKAEIDDYFQRLKAIRNAAEEALSRAYSTQ